MDRRFLNLVVHDLRNSIYSLHRMDLRHLFYKTAEIAEKAAQEAKATKKKNKLIALAPWNSPRKPVISSTTSNFFALLRESRESTIMMANSSGGTRILEIDSNSLITVEPMDYGKGPNCVCFSTPDPDPFMDNLDSPQNFFVLDLVPGSSTSSFEVLNHFGSDDPSQPLVPSSHFNWNWIWTTLPVPPFLDDPAYHTATKVKMCSSMLLGGSTICVSSMEEGIGTYTFDTASRNPEWSRAGNWVLPFCGKAEYVPDLNLWFALSASTSSPHGLCALDVPAMNFESPPELHRTWDYLDLPETPYRRLLVNLGSGKFCIISFFKTSTFDAVHEIIKGESAVFTGLEVRRCNSSEGSVRMIKHMSKRYRFQK
jgi:hypothetical protein